jgi:3-oxoadipate enol-lactonase
MTTRLERETLTSQCSKNGCLLNIGDLQLWVEESGQGQPLLLIAGLGYASWCWHELAAVLALDFRVISFDNRGAGRSDKPPAPYSIPMLADDAAAVLEATGVESAHVLGHSMGGYIALTLALRHPQKVRSLFLVGTSPGGHGTAPVPEETQAVWRLAGTLPPSEYARASMPKSFAPGWTDAHPERFERILEERLRYPTPAACWLAQFQACAQYVSAGAEVERITVPTTVLHGAQDAVVPVANGRLLARRLPGAEYIELPDAGHLPFLEDPAAFEQHLRAHLGGVRHSGASRNPVS